MRKHRNRGIAKAYASASTAVRPIILLGDHAYPLLRWRMKGYPDKTHLTGDKKLLNYRQKTAECFCWRRRVSASWGSPLLSAAAVSCSACVCSKATAFWKPGQRKWRSQQNWGNQTSQCPVWEQKSHTISDRHLLHFCTGGLSAGNLPLAKKWHGLLNMAVISLQSPVCRVILWIEVMIWNCVWVLSAFW